MLYQELQRVNDIDTAIADLHNHLNDLYKERATLISGTVKPANGSKQPIVALPATDRDNLINTYYQLQSTWEALGAKFPKLKTVEKKLQKALTIKYQLGGDLQIVAVPTTRTLQKILASNSGVTQQFVAESELLAKSRKSTSWRFIVVAASEQSLPINGLKQFIKDEQYLYQDYDCRGMGLYELIAAELQGVEVVSAGRWTVLLKDQFDVGNWACAFRKDDQIVFDLEDTDCLIGENYLPIAIKA